MLPLIARLVLVLLVITVASVLLFMVVKFVSIGLSHTTALLVATEWVHTAYILPRVTAILSLAVTLLSNPVHGLISLITTFFNVVILYLCVGAEFLAFTFLIVYVGAIAILFLFVIMLLNVKELSNKLWKSIFATQEYAMLLAIASFVYIIWSLDQKFLIVLSGYERLKFAIESCSIGALLSYIRWEFTDVFVFGDLLYTHYDGLFMLIVFMLLAAMLGAIILATRNTGVIIEHVVISRPRVLGSDVICVVLGVAVMGFIYFILSFF